MRVTVTELDGEADLEAQWAALCEHTTGQRSELVVLPEMPFAAWLPGTRDVDPAAWEKAAADHEDWFARLDELGATTVLTSRPVVDGGRRLNEAVVWEAGSGARGAHRKTYLPDEPGFWEASWYERGATVFEPVDASVARIGFLVCSEVWFGEHARSYARAGVEVIACPRATEGRTVEKWIAAGQVAAVSAGAFCLSANRVGEAGEALFGGTGWVIDPDGDVIARTSPAQPFVTVDVDLDAARAAKRTYPRYVADGPLD